MTKTLEPAQNPLPLAGLNVVELHAIGPVPFAGQLLRTLGAKISRISPPADPGLGTPIKNNHDLLNAGKERVLLDLKSSDGMAQLHQRLASADLLLEGFRPGVLERLNLAPTQLLVQYPRLVIGRLSGWGTHGALTERAGHDINYLALCGILNAIGPKQAPVPPLNVVGDFGGGAMHLLLGVLAKLVQRGINGKGGVVETSILAGSVGLTYMFYGMIESGLWQLGRESNILDGHAPFYRVYPTSDQRFVAVGAIEAKFYRELLQVMELGHEVDASKQYAKDTWPATVDAFTRRFAQLPRDEWARRAGSKDCCLAPVLNFSEAAADPHNRANRLYRDQPFAQPDTTIWFDRDLQA